MVLDDRSRDDTSGKIVTIVVAVLDIMLIQKI